MINATNSSAKHQISEIEITSDLLADRGGLVPFMHFVDQTGIVEAIVSSLGGFRIGAKGIRVTDLVRQCLAFLMDGTSRHLTFFDHLKGDPSYAAVMETDPKDLASSHQIKRFFSKISSVISNTFRALLRKMFGSRISRVQPQVVELFLDTMVLDNDDALCRQGSQPTYKKVKGFQPLQLIWKGQIVDAQFRGGSKNGNHGQTAFLMIEKAVKVIRRKLGHQVPVLVRMDGGFFDGHLFQSLDNCNIGFVCSGRLSKEIKEFAANVQEWECFDSGKQCWSYSEFGNKCKSWDRFYRTIYLRPQYDDGQMILEFARPENVILTNMGSCRFLFRNVDPAVRERLFNVENLISEHHAKGADELTHRGLKDFGFEQLPFKKFGPNMAFYYMMVIGFNLMESYKSEILCECNIVGKRSYATTVRRTVIDFAAKIVRSGRKTVMKVTAATMERVKLKELWERCNKAIPLLL
jgi:hypothetical protein